VAAVLAMSSRARFVLLYAYGFNMRHQRCRRQTSSMGVAMEDIRKASAEPGQRESRFDQIIGNSPALESVLADVEQVAHTDSTVLVLGETGTGKEVIAQAIHEASLRRQNRFVALNCAAIPSALLESELAGHERGAFTGAVAQTMGRFQSADRGTLFLDEVGDLPLELQPKLLRAVQLHSRHQATRFDCVWIANPQTEIIGSIRRHSGANRVSTHQVSEIGAEPSICYRARDLVTVDAGCVLKNASTFGRTTSQTGRPPLILCPSIELVAWLHIDAEQHFCVLNAAILGALPEKEAGLMRIDPHLIRVIGDEVRLASQTRYPKTVICVCRQQSDERRRRVGRITHGYVEFVCRCNPEAGVAVLPPELMSNRDHSDCIGGLATLFGVRNHTCRCHEQGDHDQNRNDCPSEFHLIAAVYLGRFWPAVNSASELKNHINEQGEYDYENCSGNCQHKQRQPKNRVGGCRRGSENVRWAQ
jgi:hypothetical protein